MSAEGTIQNIQNIQSIQNTQGIQDTQGPVPATSALTRFTEAEEAELTALYTDLLAHIRALEPQLHVFEEPISPENILREVRELFRLWPQPSARPALFGVPVGVKAIFNTRGWHIRCGSLLPRDCFAGPEAELVTRLRRAGAIVLGMTATSEFAHAEPAATRNPRNQAHTPGGSSSGSAAGIAAGFFPLALGTQTKGSVIRPAAFCGIPGFKPSLGRLSGRGIVPFAASIDQPGFFCASADDIPRVLALLTDAGWASSRRPLPAGRKEIWLGVPDGPYLERPEPYAQRAFAESLRRLSDVQTDAQGAVRFRIKHVPCLENFATILRRHDDLAAAEAASVHAPWFKDFRHLYRPRTVQLREQGMHLPASVVEEGRQSMADVRRHMEALMDEHGLDAWIAPAAPGEAPAGLESTGDPCMNVPWTHAGFPVMAIPHGQGPAGLPLGLQLAGRWGADEDVAVAGIAALRSLQALRESGRT